MHARRYHPVILAARSEGDSRVRPGAGQIRRQRGPVHERPRLAAAGPALTFGYLAALDLAGSL
ncbi:MAG: hypothetical protein J2P32_15800 [Actinobacteria bacterium]|nr:hypothetical protein [Actinomycetota bacterium]